MKRILSILVVLIFTLQLGFCQNLTQTIRGQIKDIDSQLPLVGVTIMILDSDPIIGTSTNELGQFKLENVPIGRINLRCSYLGYDPVFLNSIVVGTGKEIVLNVGMEESSVKMNEVVVVANKNKGETLNEMTLVSARSISAEETDRYAGGFNDPSRILSSFAGVTTGHDGGNEIIVRGNSPKYIQWRLEGIEITNPNHFGDQSGVGGSISALNNNLLATSDFHSGAFSPEFGDALSGIYDIRMRSGNNEKFESVFGFGLLGTDFTFEGPINKSKGSSFLVNYRYSTASIINALGLLGDINGIPKFQDAAFKVNLPSKKYGTFSFFGLAGLSSLLFEDVTPALWETPGTIGPNQREDFKKKANLLNLGFNHTISLNDQSYFKTSLSFSNEGNEDLIFEKEVLPTFDLEGKFVEDSLIAVQENYKGDLRKNSYRASFTYNRKINAKNKLQIGSKYIFQDFKNQQSQLDDSETRLFLVDFNENIGTIRNYISWKYKPLQKMTIVGGIHNMNVLYNKKSTIEPRLAVSFALSERSSINGGYGLHSSMESVHHYFARIPQNDGTYLEPNKDLGLLKSHHYILGFQHRFANGQRFKIESYYQDLFNLPVENDRNSFYATLNEGLEFNYVDLVNQGSGKNYGVEITFEKYFKNRFYYQLNATFYKSKYTALDQVERNTRYDGGYLFNGLFGVEFEKMGKRNNQTLALNAKLFWGGGKKIIPLLRDNNGNLAVDAEQNMFWDYDKAYQDKIEDIYLVVLSASYKWNLKRTAHEIYLTLDNLTNSKGRISEYYDEREPNSIGYVKQFGFFPNLLYRFYF